MSCQVVREEFGSLQGQRKRRVVGTPTSGEGMVKQDSSQILGPEMAGGGMPRCQRSEKEFGSPRGSQMEVIKPKTGWENVCRAKEDYWIQGVHCV